VLARRPQLARNGFARLVHLGAAIAAQRLQPSAEHRAGLARAQSAADALGDAELDISGQTLRATLLRLAAAPR
ncbi:hypothetical protein, partial [Tahibacter caeni]|uniref:hypothetical protein n=1 Tax=Tahibacter caeni TaxID=1453545 RepID=UPI00214806DF